jgi:tRNA(Arg) A34 adenosine deaminase TadA
VQEAGREPKAPERRGTHLATVACPCSMPSPRLPMAGIRKSEYGWKVRNRRDATSLARVLSERT